MFLACSNAVSNYPLLLSINTGDFNHSIVIMQNLMETKTSSFQIHLISLTHSEALFSVSDVLNGWVVVVLGLRIIKKVEKNLCFLFLKSFHVGIPYVHTQELVLVINCPFSASKFWTLLSNEPKWLLFSNDDVGSICRENYHTTTGCNNSYVFFSSSLLETMGTRVLVPFPFGIVVLFIAQHV
ncbi:hypothetical protein Csa_020581 [Cucumis sativus]|uniref:Uncharacterized protein n=1 Tax=Cucumis sativus TaxID=3659 RepID=A0A0A0K5Z7_CUCSA|nr:hypothetical protein Csa_020581 [Cucumis sativus]